MSLSRFKGCLVGAVVGDCIGALYEGEFKVSLVELLETVGKKLDEARKIHKEHGTRPADMYGLSYTDDTAMARSVASSLLEKDGFDASDMARRFATEFKRDPTRGYGGNVCTVFSALLEPDLVDVYKPAREQFDGSGSYGNGGAMRIAPLPLFTFFENDLPKLESMVTSITRLTHTHPLAIHGAMLQALAVDQSLRLPQGADINADQFLDSLISKIKPIEEQGSNHDPVAKKMVPKRRLDADPNPYCAKLQKIKDFVQREDLQATEVEDVLGNDVSALGSVPAAVLSFLKGATKSQPGMEGRNKFEQTVIYAISLAGDTDTIATMAGAMAGAVYGIEMIPEAWQYYCEGVADAETMAELLFSRVDKGKSCTSNTASNTETPTLPAATGDVSIT